MGTVFNSETPNSSTIVFILFKQVGTLTNSLKFSLSTSAFKAI